jgi:hypothetical protein
VGKRANSGGRRSGAGRKEARPNKLTADVKAAIMAAFDEVGGADHLKTVATTDPHVLYAARQDPANAGRRRCRRWARPHRIPMAAAAVQRVVIPCSPRRSSLHCWALMLLSLWSARAASDGCWRSVRS